MPASDTTTRKSTDPSWKRNTSSLPLISCTSVRRLKFVKKSSCFAFFFPRYTRIFCQPNAQYGNQNDHTIFLPSLSRYCSTSYREQIAFTEHYRRTVILLSRKYTSARIMVTPNEYAHTLTIVTMSVCLRSISKSGLKLVAFEQIPTRCVVLDQISTQTMRKYWQGCQSQ